MYRFSESEAQQSTAHGLTAPADLKKEQLEAVTTLCSKWDASGMTPGAGEMDDEETVESLKRSTPVSGFTAFFSRRVGPKDFYTEGHWCWNQSHRKILTEAYGREVFLRKYTPKRVSPRNVRRSNPVAPSNAIPPYKLWVIEVLIPSSPFYFVWIERGAEVAASRRLVLAPANSHHIPPYSRPSSFHSLMPSSMPVSPDTQNGRSGRSPGRSSRSRSRSRSPMELGRSKSPIRSPTQKARSRSPRSRSPRRPPMPPNAAWQEAGSPFFTNRARAVSDPLPKFDMTPVAPLTESSLAFLMEWMEKQEK